MTTPFWTERRIGSWLVHNTFQRAVVAVPNCNYTGHEADVLLVHRSGRLIDVEIKISRADLKADAKKDKWWQRWSTLPYPDSRRDHVVLPQPRHWPPRIWKHYYCLPAALWKPELAEFVKPRSGVLLLVDGDEHGPPAIRSERKATANRDAKPIEAEATLNIARLCGLRMWDCYDTIEAMRRDREEEKKPQPLQAGAS